MILKSLKINNFRNIDRFEWTPHERANLIVGANAQGKTNLLESVYLLGTTKPLRHGNHEEQIQQGKNVSRVQGVVWQEKNALERDLEINLSRDSPKKVTLNGKRLAPLSKIFGELSVVLFVPEDLQMVKAGPSTRRFFLDLEISQASPEYLTELQTFQRVLRQRNAALRMWADGSAGQDAVFVFDEPLIESGSAIIQYRLQALAELAPLAANLQERVSRGSENLTLEYQSSIEANPNASLPLNTEEDEIKAMFLRQLELKKGWERGRSTTLTGPHRDDMVIKINGQLARGFASQGQQRTAALALKLAEVHFLRNRLGENPVLLLDDVLSELDPERQGELLGLLDEHVQTFVTTTHSQDLAYKPGQTLKVNAGTLTPA